MTGERGPKAEIPGDCETLIGLVGQYSPSGEEAGAVAWLVEHMQVLGFDQTYRDEVGNAIGIMGNGQQQVILLGHIDTVPGEIPVRVAGDILHGRGSVDAKGPLAAFVDAVARIGPVEGWQFVVIGAIDEERNSIGARHIVDQYRPDFAIIGEPSRWDRITLGYKGSAWAEVTAKRSTEHTAGQGESAPEAAVNIWQRIQTWVDEFNQQHERAFDKILPTLRGFSSGTDNFQEWATLQIGVRLPEELGPAQWYQKLQELADAPGAELQPTGFPIPTYRAERNSALVRAFLGGIRSEGGKPGFVVKTGTADLNIVAPVWDCPAVAYGPGDSSLDHTPNEHILLAEYQKAVAVLSGVLKKLSSVV
jgi:[amino group carrier protein]-lysine/ornithine hydrolase